MEATQAQLLSLLDGKKQFTIPIYQRTYSWQLRQCRQLLSDIERVGADEKEISHFIGSVVYFKPGNAPMTSVPELLVIDGQQRLTTVSLLLLALTDFLGQADITLEDETGEEIRETYLLNKHRKDDSRFKLLLTRKDKDTFTGLMDGREPGPNPSERILENYAFFRERIHADNALPIYRGIRKLIIVDVILEREKDNPQLIFESLNSTGLALSQADLIRNYLLMGLAADLQQQLYERYWYPMERYFGERIDTLSWFVRDYLTMKGSAIPRIDQVYEAYKKFLRQSGMSIEQAIEELHRYARYYVRMALQQEPDADLGRRFREVHKLKVETSYPFLMAVYGDHEAGLLTKQDFAEVIGMVVGYTFRRAICGIATNSLNKTFATLHRKAEASTYLDSLKAAFIGMGGYRRFPSDAEFAKELQQKDVYNFRSSNYLLASLENHQRKERVHVDNYTIEHVMPQNPNLSAEWQQELGPEWAQLQERYLHTLGNLSLTAYNAELSDRPFSEKKRMTGGFASSPLYLNASVAAEDRWDEHAILRRAAALAVRACQVWPRPELSEARLRQFQPVQDAPAYDLSHYGYLQDEMLSLYQLLERRLLGLDAGLQVECKKYYIAFKSEGSNLVDVEPQKKRLKLYLNTKFEQMQDPKGLCKDVSGVGRRGNGEVEVVLEAATQLDDVMELVEQVFEGV